jgi:imidazolonepropionase-like amidohydrolase
MTIQEVQAATDEASRYGTYVAAHCHSTRAMALCAQAGVRTIEHRTFVAPDGMEQFDPEVAEDLASRGTVVVPTVSFAGRWIEQADVSTMAQLERTVYEERRASFERRLAIVGQLYSAGVALAIGSDAANGRTIPSEFDDLIYEMLLHQRAGMPEMDVIRSATGWSADGLMIGDVKGRLIPGLQADMLVVDGDPIRNLEALGKVKLVVRAGKIVGGSEYVA